MTSRDWLGVLTLVVCVHGCSDDQGPPADSSTGTDAATATGMTTTPLPTTGEASTGSETLDPTGQATEDPTTTTADPTEDPTGEDPPGVSFLEPVDHLIRASMALRGVRPQLVELETVAADPSQLPGIVDQYLEDPRFVVTIQDMYAEALLLRAQLTPSMVPFVNVMAGMDNTTYMDSVPEEPLKVIGWVVAENRPFFEIVTTDKGFVNEVGAKVWKVDGYDDNAGGWQEVTFTDGRPSSGGILRSAALWRRHLSNGKNYHRGRANVVSAALLCDDYVALDVPPFDDVDLSSDAAVTMALVNNPGCVGCHQTLDPLASFVWGWQSRTRGGLANAYDANGDCIDPNDDRCYPMTAYKPADEKKWENTTKRPPAFFGKPFPDGNVDELGGAIAEDPRFAECVVRRFYSYMAQIQLDAVPLTLVDELLAAYESGNGADARALARAIVLSDAFRVSHADPELADELVGIKVARPEQLERTIFDLTGFVWLAHRPTQAVHGHFPLMASDEWGYRAMAGGIDGFSITQPTFTFNATRSLTVEALSEEAAGYVVDRDFAEPDPTARRLLKLVTPDSDDQAVRDQLVYLHGRVLGELVTAESPAVEASFALWTAVTGTPEHKWKTVLTAMFQDHRINFF